MGKAHVSVPTQGNQTLCTGGKANPLTDKADGMGDEQWRAKERCVRRVRPGLPALTPLPLSVFFYLKSSPWEALGVSASLSPEVTVQKNPLVHSKG